MITALVILSFLATCISAAYAGAYAGFRYRGYSSREAKNLIHNIVLIGFNQKLGVFYGWFGVRVLFLCPVCGSKPYLTNVRNHMMWHVRAGDIKESGK